MNIETDIIFAVGEPATKQRPISERISLLANSLASELAVYINGDFCAEIYPEGHERGVFLRSISSRQLTVPVTDLRPAPSAVAYQQIAEAMFDLESDVERLFQLSKLVHDYLQKTISEDRRLEEDERDNLITVAVMIREQALALKVDFHRAGAI